METCEKPDTANLFSSLPWSESLPYIFFVPVTAWLSKLALRMMRCLGKKKKQSCCPPVKKTFMELTELKDILWL